MTAASFATTITKLARHYGPAPKPFPINPFEQVLWENVAYLADDADRLAAFAALKSGVGLLPEKILHAPPAKLLKVTSAGILAEQFAGKLRECARIILDEFHGSLDAIVKLPLAQAKRALRRFPGIGEPGAEKILLFSGSQRLLAPDSNALRVLGRLGVTPQEKSYSATYATAGRVMSQLLPSDTGWVQSAHQLLRRHGREICRRSRPACSSCPLRAECPRIGVAR